MTSGDIMYCCANKHGMKEDNFDSSTISYNRKRSIELLLEGTSINWGKAKKNGWQCLKVQILLNKI